MFLQKLQPSVRRREVKARGADGWMDVGEFVTTWRCYYHKDQPNVGKYTIHGSYGKDLLGGGFNYFLIFTPENWGNDPILTIIFFEMG